MLSMMAPKPIKIAETYMDFEVEVLQYGFGLVQISASEPKIPNSVNQ